MIDPDKTLTLNDLIDHLHIEIEFSGWHYGDAENELMIKIKFGDTTIATSSVRIEPVGYAKEEDEW